MGPIVKIRTRLLKVAWLRWHDRIVIWKCEADWGGTFPLIAKCAMNGAPEYSLVVALWVDKWFHY